MIPALIEVLRAQLQASEDGSMVIVSRQAVDEAATLLADMYALGLMAEEMGEAIQLIGKGLRFGMDTPGRTGETARQMLPAELGDVEAAIHFGCVDGIAAFTDVIRARETKKARLLSPDSVDQQGNRLAPEPRGQRKVEG